MGRLLAAAALLLGGLLLAEAALEGAARLRLTPLLAAGAGQVERLESLRLSQGRPYRGFRPNAGGYHDQEFFRSAPDDLVVALLTDSFGVGVVPFAFNFATVAEGRLRQALGGRFERVAIHNFGVSGIGLSEYAYLLETEVEALAPRFVLLGIFVGNDLHLDAPFGSAGERNRLSPRGWRLWQLLRLAGLLARERLSGAGGPAAEVPAPAAGGVPVAGEERPTYSEAAFLAVELARLEVCDTESPEIEARSRALLRGLDWFQRRLGERLLLAVFPDEYQVNDALWRELLAGRPRPERFVRQRPQELIAAWCRERGAACLDLLPVLRRAEAGAPTYHRRDTHWNARGNAAVGEALAEWIAARVADGA